MEDVIGKNHGLGEIAGEIRHRFAHGIGQCFVIGLGDRIDDGVIDPLIALEHRAIHFLVGVRGLARALGQIGDVARRLDGSGGVVQRFGRRLGGEELGRRRNTAA